MYKCIYCNKEFKNKGGQGSHVPYCKINPLRIQRKAHGRNNGFKKGCVSSRKGIAMSNETKQKIGLANKGKTHSAETKLKLSLLAKNQGFGGKTEGGGRGKKGYYKGIWCDSSWELAFLLYCHDNNVFIERNKAALTYIYENKIRKYYPDFIVNGELIEIKGYKTKQWEEKIKANPNVKVLYFKEMKPILKYIKEKYGVNFIELYD